MSWLSRLFRRNALERDLDRELRFHLDAQTEDLVRSGLSRAEAGRRARLEFGGVEQVKEAARDARGSRWLDDWWQDTRYALRTLRRTPGFTAAAVLTFALGIGATTVMVSVADHVVLRPLPYAEADRLFVAHEIIQEMIAEYPTLPANAGHYLEWRRECRACDGVAAIRPVSLTLTGAGDPERLGAVRVSGNLFPLLGAHPQLGRLLAEDDDDQAGDDHVVVLSDAFWRRAFGADPSILGRTLTLNNAAWLVVGVLPRDFRFPRGHQLGAPAELPSQMDVFVPLALTPRERTTPGEFDYSVIARLAPGATLAQAQAQLDAIQAGISRNLRDRMTLGAALTPLQQQIVGASGRALLLLLAAVAAMLLVVCVNLANLLLARYAGRLRESAVRIAIGAGRGRLVRQALTESLVLALLGGGLGILLSRWGLAALLRLAPADLPRLNEVHLDGRVLVASIVISLVTGLAFGIVPAFRFGRVDPGDVLKGGGRTATDGRRARRTREVLIAAQMGLCALLLYTTGLLLASLVRVLQVDRGFTVEQALALDVELPRTGYEDLQRRTAFFDEALQRLAALPGATAAGMTSSLPLEGESQVDVLSRENDARAEVLRPSANIRFVSPGYFSALGISVPRGRTFAESDRGRNVVMLSEKAARSLWPGEDPIGKNVLPGSNDPVAQVVGIVGDVRTSSLEQEGSLIAYLPYWQNSPRTATLLLSTGSSPRAMAASARAALRAIAPAVPVSRVRTMEQVVSGAVAQRRFQVLVLLLFAGAALATASVGIYGVISHSLARRANEIGIRLALGARAADVNRLIVAEGLAPAGLGLAAGILLSLALGRTFSALLFEVRTTDPLTLIGVAVLLLLVATAACYVPARRATRHGPALALRLD